MAVFSATDCYFLKYLCKWFAYLDMRITRKEILARLKDRIVVMDGAMGTMIQKLHLDNPSEGRGVGGNLDMLNLVDPEGI